MAASILINSLVATVTRSVLLGLGANLHIAECEVNLSCNNLGQAGATVLELCLPELTNLSSLDISDNGKSPVMVTGKILRQN